MPTISTPLEAELMYHVWTHANGNENLFRTDENYRFFLEKYIHYIQPIADTFAYCLMPNHLHLMVRIKGEEEVLEFVRSKKNNPNLQGFRNLGGLSREISQQFSNLFNSYTKSYNKVYNRRGSLFIPNFKRNLIDSDRYLATVIAYIHYNPVHHGFVETPYDWPHNSWHSYATGVDTKIKRKEDAGWSVSREDFLRLHQEICMEKLISLFE